MELSFRHSTSSRRSWGEGGGRHISIDPRVSLGANLHPSLAAFCPFHGRPRNPLFRANVLAFHAGVSTLSRLIYPTLTRRLLSRLNRLIRLMLMALAIPARDDLYSLRRTSLRRIFGLNASPAMQKDAFCGILAFLEVVKRDKRLIAWWTCF